MTKKNALTDENIVSRIEAEERASYGVNDSELSGERAQAIDYYLGKPFGNEADGRSQVVSTDVADTVESILPSLLKVFTAGDQVVKFEPRGPEDVEQAEQESDYINYLVMEKGDGFNTIYTWFKDALLSKVGYVKVYWEEKEEAEKETYYGLTDDELSMLAADTSVEIIEHTAYQDTAAQLMAPGMPAMMLHDVKVQTTKTDGCIEVCPVAPESMMVSFDTKTVGLRNARFVQHREMKTLSEVREEGFDVPDDVEFTATDSLEEENNARDLYSEQWDIENEEGASRKVMVRDTYIRIDANGDGIAELMRYVVIGTKIIHQEEAEVIPFAAITPVIMPHRHVGRSIADLVMDIQLIKSTLIRQNLDNMYLANNGRYAVSDKVNLDDMLTSRPGGVVRVKGDPGANILPITHPTLGNNAFSMIEYMDGVKENRTGVTRYNQGLDANSLNKTATGIQQIMGAAQQRIELIARICAETGVKELFLLVHHLTRKYSQREAVFRLRNKWIPVDPRTWKTRADMSVTVGLGTGNKDQQLMHLQTILLAQKEALQIGVATPKNIFNALNKLTQNAGFKDPSEFWTDPGDGPLPPPPPDPKDEVAKGKLMLDKERLDFDKMKAISDIELKKIELSAPDGKDGEYKRDEVLQQQDIATKLQIEAAKFDLEKERLELDRMKAQLDAETKILIAQMNVTKTEGQGKEEPKEAAPAVGDALAMALQGFQEALIQMRSPRTATMPDGRQIRVE